MARNPIVVSPDTTIGQAGQVMGTHRIRHLPVVDRDQLVGLVTKSDLLRAASSNLDPMSAVASDDASLRGAVSTLMTRRLVTVPPTMPLEDAARLMVDHKFGAVLVMED